MKRVVALLVAPASEVEGGDRRSLWRSDGRLARFRTGRRPARQAGMKIVTTLAAASLLVSTAAIAQSPAELASMRDEALKDGVAWQLTEGLTTEVGPRLAGTEAEARARAWAVPRLKALGFSNVRTETFRMPVWVRGEEEAEILSPFPQPLRLIALGNSAATPEAGLTAEVAMFADMAALRAAPDREVRGKIVYVGHEMRRAQDGSSYGQFGAARRQGPTVASQKGAAAIIIRSIGTDSHSGAHTGVQRFDEGAEPIPAAALANAAADQLERIAERGLPIRMRLLLTPRQIGMHESGNVIAEVPGSDPDAGIVLAACHLDSWDVGTGAVDDAAGCGIVAAAAKRVMDAGQPRRTIRVLWFGAEEVGLYGGYDYTEKHGGERHALVAESDFGAGRIWRYDSRVPAAAAPVAERIAAALAPLGIGRGRTDAAGGSDITPLVESGITVMQLRQDGTNYFDWHHTEEDTLDKVDIEDLRQNVAAWTVMLSLAANAPEDLVSPPATGAVAERSPVTRALTQPEKAVAAPDD